jgi:methylenetetrahydrofolate--tRNA-(uracil-5-)-methyltransferase
MKNEVVIIGGGLAGSEAALQLASRGIPVKLYEMRGVKKTPAHKTDQLAELVCSNSLKGTGLSSAHGLFKAEIKQLGSFLLEIAEHCRVPAGESLTVDRDLFAQEVTKTVATHPMIELIRQEVTQLPTDTWTLIAAGPLCSDLLAENLFAGIGSKRLHFFDATSPVVDIDSVDLTQAYFKNRWDKGQTVDFLNCPLNKEQYEAFVQALCDAESVEPKPFEPKELFEGCLPVEEIARRGPDTLRFGPMRPVGLHTEYKPWAVVQLRAENAEKTLYNMVGFQTRLKWGTQKQIFSMIPGLQNAEFVRLGAMHRNSFIDSPKLLNTQLRLQATPYFFAGQITGAEGYTEAIGTGLYAALNLLCAIRDVPFPTMPADTCLGALTRHLTAPNEHFQPMNFNYGLLPRPETGRKSERKTKQAEASQRALTQWMQQNPELFTNRSI